MSQFVSLKSQKLCVSQSEAGAKISNVTNVDGVGTSPVSELTSTTVPVASVASGNLGDSESTPGNNVNVNGRMDLGEIRIVCKTEPMDAIDDGVIYIIPQFAQGISDETIPEVSLGSVVQPEDNGIIAAISPRVETVADEICPDSSGEGDLNIYEDSLDLKTTRKYSVKSTTATVTKSSSPKKISANANATKSSSSSRLNFPIVYILRLPSAKIASFKNKTGVKSKPGWKCPHCSKMLSCTSHLETHIRTHTGERPFRCPHCPHRTTHDGNLHRHIRKVHPKENQTFLKCKICGDKFPNQKTRSKHMEKHLECYFCSRRLTNIKFMRDHLAIHTGEKPFSCPHCQHSAVREDHLKQHIRRRHPNAEVRVKRAGAP